MNETDRIIRATAGDGYIKMAVVTARAAVQRGCSVHGCSPHRIRGARAGALRRIAAGRYDEGG